MKEVFFPSLIVSSGALAGRGLEGRAIRFPLRPMTHAARAYTTTVEHIELRGAGVTNGIIGMIAQKNPTDHVSGVRPPASGMVIMIARVGLGASFFHGLPFLNSEFTEICKIPQGKRKPESEPMRTIPVLFRTTSDVNVLISTSKRELLC
jgi:hypothetical protein